jgi:hypothetical protein
MNYLTLFAADLGVFGVADHEFDIRLTLRLVDLTRKVEKAVKKVEKSIKFLLNLKMGYLGVFGDTDHDGIRLLPK